MKAANVIRVAAVQVESHNGAMEQNLARATPLVAKAAGEGAELVLCAEFLAAGYIYEESIWESAEPKMGPTERWLVHRATEHGIYIGASYLEASGDDFYNTFTLVAPGGEIAGRVRKESLPAFEGWYFKSDDRTKMIDTELGRIAVGICQDNHTARFMRRVINASPDLVLMPHSAPCVPLARGLMAQSLCEAPGFYARSCGVPAILVNKAHTRSRTRTPIPGLRLRFDFPGMSSIVDSDGTTRAQLGDDEGYIVADVTLDPARKRTPEPPKRFYWSRPPSRWARITGAMFTVLELVAKRAYARSEARRAAARAVEPARAPLGRVA